MRTPAAQPIYLMLFLLAGSIMTSFWSRFEMESHPFKEISIFKEPINTVSVEKFREWTQSWERYGKVYEQENLILYYNMPIVDLEQVIAEGAVSSRFYMGLDTTKTPYRAHLLLVGVDVLGKDMLDETKKQYVYDLSTPCPPACN